jgi:hypothetical protein
LLHSVLEDAYKLSEAKTSRSVKSRKSAAPSRLPKKKPVKSEYTEAPHDLLADHLELEQAISFASREPRVESRSIGGQPRKSFSKQSDDRRADNVHFCFLLFRQIATLSENPFVKAWCCLSVVLARDIAMLISVVEKLQLSEALIPRQ